MVFAAAAPGTEERGADRPDDDRAAGGGASAGGGDSMMKMRRTILVTHGKHGTFRAENVADRLQAVQAAARAWGRQWSEIARECRFEDDG